MAAPGSFMETPLVVWVQTFNPDTINYQDICDGLFLNEVMLQIDPKATTEGMNNVVEDAKDRLQNWDILMKNIKIYYQDVLQQYIVMKLPNTYAICKDSSSDEAKKEITKVLLLILGCAVQSENKEHFIENIKQLQVEVQHAIVEFIKEITDDTKNVFAIEIPLDHMDEVSQSMYTHLRGLVQERDGYIEEIKELNQALQDMCDAQQELKCEKGASLQPPSPVSSNSPEKHHLAVELADCKAKLRKIRQELEEKNELTSELQEELQDLKTTSSKLRNENLELTQDARAARTYRDELDILKEKASRVEKCEAEITKYKEKLNELDFYKARVDEIREDNAILVETKNMLEDQLSASHKRIEAVIDLEKDLLSYKQQLEEINVERDIDRNKMQELAEENARLEFQQKSSFNESANLEEELQRAKHHLNAGISNSISDQMSETANAKILRLELDNQRLQKHLEEMKETSMLENATRALELEKENNRLAKKVEKLQENSTKEAQNYFELEKTSEDLLLEKRELEDAMETIKESSDRQLRELERENDQLSDIIEVLRERNEKTNDLRIKDLEKDNKRLHDNVKHYTAQVSQIELEYRQLQKQHERLQDSVEQVDTLEQINQEMKGENDNLHKTVASLKLTCDKYDKLEQEFSDLEVENKKLQRCVDSLQRDLSKLDSLERENINFNVEAQHLKRTIDILKSSSSKVLDFEHEKDELNREIQQLHKALDNSKSEHCKFEQLELNLLELDTDNQKLQRSLEAANRKVDALDKENQELDIQNEKFQKSLETTKLSLRKLDEVERENKDLELEISNIQREKSIFEKENKKLKQSKETMASNLDELSVKVTEIERENKSLRKTTDRAKDTSNRIRELEKENRDMVQRAAMDKKTLATLREDLVNEKIKAQQLSNELEKLNQELENVGLNREKLVAAEQAEDESKYKALECMMEGAFKHSMEIKEEKIHALESRLEESKSRNVTIQQELKSVKRQYEALQQRREEEVVQHTPNRERPQSSQQQTHMTNTTKEILELNNHLITVERNNATLEAERSNLRQHVSSLEARLHSTESEKSKLQHSLSSVMGQNDSVQTQLAKLQVETSTLQSQITTLLTQNTALQNTNSMLEEKNIDLLSQKEELDVAHEQLSVDHEQLGRIHEQLTSEYEALISEHGSLKANHKSLKADCKDLQDQNSKLLREQEIISQLKQTIDREKEGMKAEAQTLGNMHLDMGQAREENLRLQNSYDNVSREYRDLQAEHKEVKTEYNQLRLKHTQLKGTFAECRDQLNTMDVEISKLATRCEALSQLNTKLEEENSSLMMQLQALLTQNQELLTMSLDSKDHFAEEQKAYLERLSELRRQKEKLEEKIMEQYKRYDPVKRKNRGFGANLVRKAKQMVRGKDRSQSKERNKTISLGELSYVPDSPENSSLGSGSLGSTESPDVSSWKKTKKNFRRRRGSQNDLLENPPKLSLQNKHLAKSTTALNMSQPDSPNDHGGFALRGAKSTEYLALDTPRSARSEYDSVSSSSVTRNNSEWQERPGRRRTLLESSSINNVHSNLNTGYNGRGGSLSSEDNISRQTYSRESSMDKRSTEQTTSHRNEDDSDDDDDDDGLVSLDQFLKEIDKSPKTRRKYFKEHKKKKVDNNSKSIIEEDKEFDTKILSPEMGPRPPTTADADESKLSQSTRMCKSEMNISQLSKITASSTFHNFSDAQRDLNRDFYPMTPQMSRPSPEKDLATSTPKYPGYSGQDAAFSVRTFKERQRAMSSTEDNVSHQPQPMKARENMGQYPSRNGSLDVNNYGQRYSGSGSSGTSTPDHHTSAFKPPQANPQYITAPQRPSYTTGSIPQPSLPEHSYSPSTKNSQYASNNVSSHGEMKRQSSGSSIGSYNATTRQASVTGPNPIIPTPTRVVGSLNASNLSQSLPRQAPVDRIPRAKSVGPEMMMKSAFSPPERYHDSNTPSFQRQLPSRPESGMNNNNYNPQYKPSSNGPVEGQEMSSQYNPGNVRSLVQTYQNSVNQAGPLLTNEKQTPVPPPRRSRPMSAGPLRLGEESAFSVPTRPKTPNLKTEPYSPPPLHRPEGAGGRVLPQTPAERRAQQQQQSRQGDPGQTPPKPQGGSRLGPDGEPLPKNSIWYEYGCV